MNTVRAALAQTSASEVRFGATVTSTPHFFWGSNTHAMHEAFRVKSDDGVGLEIVDNVALAPRIAVRPGDRIEVQGELVPGAARGPLVHWTHHDPSGVHPGGFIDWDGRRYA
jgi:hypothetical protein